MPSVIEFYNLKNWYDVTFSSEEKECITKYKPILNNLNYKHIEKSLYFALTDCLLNDWWYYGDEKAISKTINAKIFLKALTEFYRLKPTPLEKHLFYNIIIEHREKYNVYEDLFLIQLCNEQISNTEQAKKMFLENNIKLGKCMGYSVLLRIYKSRDEIKYKELCKKALDQGWAGNYKNSFKAILFKEKRENDQFNEMYLNKKEIFNSLKYNNKDIYFCIIKDSVIVNKTQVTSISFNYGNISVFLLSGEKIIIPMNMILEDYCFLRNGRAAFFNGKDERQIFEDSFIPDCGYMLSTFEEDLENPLINHDLPRDYDNDIENEGLLEEKLDDDELDDEEDLVEEENDDDEFDNEEDFDDEEYFGAWYEFYPHLKQRLNCYEIVIATIYSIDDDSIEINGYPIINKENGILSITINDKTFNIKESPYELDVYIPKQNTQEEDLIDIGYVYCTVNIDDKDIDVSIVFFVPTQKLLAHIKKECGKLDSIYELLEIFKKLKYYLADNSREKFNTPEKLAELRSFYQELDKEAQKELYIDKNVQDLLEKRYSSYYFNESIRFEDLYYAPVGYWEYLDEHSVFSNEEYWKKLIEEIDQRVKNIENYWLK